LVVGTQSGSVHLMTTIEISPAALYRSIARWNPTFIVDEFDTVLAADDKKASSAPSSTQAIPLKQVATAQAASVDAVNRMRAARKARAAAVRCRRPVDHSGYPGGWPYKPQRHCRTAQRSESCYR
jgi:hypothetical protein